MGKDKAPIRSWLAEPMTPDVRRAIQRMAASEDVACIAVMPDVHLGERACNGCVVATTRLIYPDAVGGDIGCGYTSVALDLSADAVDSKRAQRLLRAIAQAVPVLRHRSLAGAPPLPADLDPRDLSRSALASHAGRDGRIEFGTLGRGNHFIELQSGGDGRVWALVHSGSRGVGPAVAPGPGPLDAASDAGRAYLQDAAWAVRYASANRRAIIEAVIRILRRESGAIPSGDSMIDTSHNHVAIEEHEGAWLVVHRKGANTARDGQPNIIPGSVATATYHVTGRGHAPALMSSSHGAGRALSRSEARRVVTRRELLRSVEGVTIDERAADRLREEAPRAYKDIRAVMRPQRDLVRVERTLRPLVCYKAP